MSAEKISYELKRFAGIQRDYKPEEVERLRGSIKIEYSMCKQQSQKLWRLLNTEPKSEYLTSKLENGTYSMYHQQYRMALKLFTDVINEDPKWAEGWNKRATLLFIMGNYEKSLEDIERVLDLEPRHFGALSGRAQIYLSYKQYEKAIDDLEKAQSIYPLIKSGENIKIIEQIIKDQQI